MLLKGELRYIQILRDRGTCIDSRLDEIEEQLIRGDIFEKMYHETKNLISYEIKGNMSYATLVWLQKKMFELEQKYFPKPKDKIVELVKEIDKGVKELLNMCGG